MASEYAVVHGGFFRTKSSDPFYIGVVGHTEAHRGTSFPVSQIEETSCCGSARINFGPESIKSGMVVEVVKQFQVSIVEIIGCFMDWDENSGQKKLTGAFDVPDVCKAHLISHDTRNHLLIVEILSAAKFETWRKK